MIKLTTKTSDGYRMQYLHPDAIAGITEAGPSSQWHGIRAYIRTFEGKTIEVNETADWIASELAKERAANRSHWTPFNCPHVESCHHVD